MRTTLGLAALAAVLACGGANAQQVNVKVGVLSDMSSLYSDIGGAGSVAAAKLAIADFTAQNKDVKVDLVSADHQNKPTSARASPTSGTTSTRWISSSTCRTPAWRWR